MTRVFGLMLAVVCCVGVAHAFKEEDMVKVPGVGLTVVATDKWEPGSKSYTYPKRPGPIVQSIVNNSPADKSGLQRFDVIHSVDGKPCKTPEDVVRLLGSLKSGDAVRVTRSSQEEVRVAAGRRWIWKDAEAVTIKVEGGSAAAIANMMEEKDEFQGRTFHKHKNIPALDGDSDNIAYVYFTKDDKGGAESPRLLVSYRQKDWVFFTKVHLKIGDADAVTLPIGKVAPVRELVSGGVREVVDIPLTDDVIAKLDAGDKTPERIAVRLEGKKTFDREMKEEERIAMHETIQAYRALSRPAKP